MIIRPYLDSDEAAIKAMHKEMGSLYDCPDFTKPQFLVRTVLENGNGRPEMALFLRKTAETYLLFEHGNMSKRQIIGRILAIGKESELAAKRAGIEDVHAFIPPEIEKFGKLLIHLGWEKDWPCYSRKVDLHGP